MIRFIYFCAAALVLTVGITGGLYMMDGIKEERAAIAMRETRDTAENVASIGSDDNVIAIDDAAAALNDIETAAGANPALDDNDDFGAAFTDVAPPALQDGKSVLPVADMGVETETE